MKKQKLLFKLLWIGVVLLLPLQVKAQRTQYYTGVDIYKYYDNMTITCCVMLDGQLLEDCELAVFDSKGELRGSSISDAMDGGRIYLTVQGDGKGEVLHFKVVYGSDDANRKIIDVNESYEYFANARVGSYSLPYIFTATTTLVGDVNLDGKVNIVDIVYLIDVLLGKESITVNSDVNSDSKVDKADVEALKDIILQK